MRKAMRPHGSRRSRKVVYKRRSSPCPDFALRVSKSGVHRAPGEYKEMPTLECSLMTAAILYNGRTRWKDEESKRGKRGSTERGRRPGRKWMVRVVK